MRTFLRWALVSLVIAILLLAAMLATVTVLDGPLPTKARNSVATIFDAYSDALMDRAERGCLTTIDRWVLRLGLLIGTTFGRYHYPEASMVLNYYVYGDGSPLELPHRYFASSSYLNRLIASLGDGKHGPIALKQRQDWRLSLALNPFYLSVSGKKVRIYHPRIEFAPVGSARVVTIVPIGKLKLRIYDNLVSALNPTPFEAYAEWSRP